MGVGLRPGAKAPEEPPTPYRLRAPPRLYQRIWSVPWRGRWRRGGERNDRSSGSVGGRAGDRRAGGRGADVARASSAAIALP